MAQTNKTTTVRKGDYQAVIAFNDRIAQDIYRMGLSFIGQAAQAYANLQPGQFAELDLSRTGIPPADKIPPHLTDKLQRQIILRRPFSFSNVIVTDEGVCAELIYAALGPASLRMTTVQPGDTMDVIGPLGRGFWVPEGKEHALLVAGGLGTPPIIHMAHVLNSDYSLMERVAFVGARNRNTLPLVLEGDHSTDFLQSNTPCFLATDDGSAGHHGLVTDYLKNRLHEHEDLDRQSIVIYACGPEPMLAAVAHIATEQDIACQVSLERRMACGFNLCQGCAVECRIHDQAETVYKMCCQDGPVFDSQEVVFE